MKINVPDLVLKEAAKCPHNFACLESGECGGKEMCEVDYANGKDVLFLTDRKPAICPYRLQFAGRQICRCPVYYYLKQT